MGLFGALFAGVSGLDSQSNKIGVISNNISNVNTIGYKQGSADFDTLVVPSGTTAFSPGGVIGGNQQLVNQQGVISATTSSTDIAISGGGMLFVSAAASGGTSNQLFTRSGSFTQDANGNFVNSDGYYLQGLPIDPSTGEPETFSDLTTVNVSSSATGKPTPTSTITLGANFDATQTALLGPGETISSLGGQYNGSIPADQIIVGNDIAGENGIDIKRGDSFTISDSGSTSVDTFTYGGFAIGRNVTQSTSTGDGGDVLVTDTVANAFTTSATNITAATTSSAITGIDIQGPGDAVVDDPTATPPISGLFAVGTLTVDGTGNSINITTGETLTQIATAINALGGGISAAVSGNPGNYNLTVTDISTGTGIGIGGTSIVSTSTFEVAAPENTGTGGAPLNSQVQINITPSSDTNNYVLGDYVNVSDAIPPTGSSLTASQINGIQKIVAINPSGTITVALSDGATETGTPTANTGGATVTNRTYPFTGTILNAQSASDDFLNGIVPANTFTGTALNFYVSVNGNSTKFTYNANPDPSSGTFNSMDTLVEAINDATGSGLTAQVTDGRLYISGTNPDETVTFQNGDDVGTPTSTPPLAGINWTQELDLPTQLSAPPSGTFYFNSLQSLANAVNTADPTNLVATVTNPTGDSTLSINEANAQQTITFTDGADNSGSLLKEFGFVNTVPVGGSNPNQSTISLPKTYDATNPAKNMSSGAITPQFTKDITIYDSLGQSHTIAMNVAKIATGEWAVEFTAVPANDVISADGSSGSNADGQIAAGIVTFNDNGELVQNAAAAALENFTINWNQQTVGASPSSVSVNLGQNSSSSSDASSGVGLTQAAGAFNVSTDQQNGSPTGELTGVSIDSNGYVIANFSNGQTQKMFQLPLANFTNPDGLLAVSGNAYQATLASGPVNPEFAGTSGVGTFTPSALEQSNVDLSTQLTDLIVAQQAYGANSKVLTVADTLLQELDQIIQ